MKQFLSAKHWQLFILQFALPFISYLVLYGYVIISIITHRNPFLFIDMMPYFFIIMAISMFFYFGWIWTIGNELFQKNANHIPLKLSLKTYNLLMMLIVVFYFMYFLFLTMVFKEFRSFIDSPVTFLLIWFSMLILSLGAMFCHFYFIFFVSKLLKSIETKKEALFSDYILDYILILFFPIGVWFIQPRINKLFESNDIN
jgi:hypothetical protein